ncbi:MAG: trimethylamine methyltransferase, partial [Gammaproteobacteria bacterium]|nr:trimethylamine methyltransferase [Gammaproteobacteria bacterium]
MTEKTKQTSRRKRRGREARRKDRANSSNSNAIWPGIEGGLYQPLTERDVGKVHQAALTIVEQTGIADA